MAEQELDGAEIGSGFEQVHRKCVPQRMRRHWLGEFRHPMCLTAGDAALHAAFDFCMNAKDMEFATIIAEAITIEMIQDKIVEEYPQYFLIDRRDGRIHPTTAASLGYFLK